LKEFSRRARVEPSNKLPKNSLRINKQSLRDPTSDLSERYLISVDWLPRDLLAGMFCPG